MRKIITAFVMAIIMLCLAGCGGDIETVQGVWRSNDGYVMVLTEDKMTLTDASGANVLGRSELEYIWKDSVNNPAYADEEGSVLCVVIDDEEYDVFDCYLTEDTLRLTYTDEFLRLMGLDPEETTDYPIRLYRNGYQPK